MPSLPNTRAGATTYRAELCRCDTPGRTSRYYDGGDFSPYCMESLIELLRSETHTPYESMGLTLEIRGRCSSATLKEIARRFGEIEAPNLRINICAKGFPTVTVNSSTNCLQEHSAGPPRSATSRKHS